MKNVNIDVNIDNTIEYETCCGDVTRILSYTTPGSSGKRGYTLYKTSTIGIDWENSKLCVYFMMIEDDNLPLIITEEAAQQILKDPEKGQKLAYNRWFDRYR